MKTFLLRTTTFILFLGSLLYTLYHIDQTGAFDDLTLGTGLLVGALAALLIGIAVEDIWPA